MSRMILERVLFWKRARFERFSGNRQQSIICKPKKALFDQGQGYGHHFTYINNVRSWEMSLPLLLFLLWTYDVRNEQDSQHANLMNSPTRSARVASEETLIIRHDSLSPARVSRARQLLVAISYIQKLVHQRQRHIIKDIMVAAQTCAHPVMSFHGQSTFPVNRLLYCSDGLSNADSQLTSQSQNPHPIFHTGFTRNVHCYPLVWRRLQVLRFLMMWRLWVAVLLQWSTSTTVMNLDRIFEMGWYIGKCSHFCHCRSRNGSNLFMCFSWTPHVE